MWPQPYTPVGHNLALSALFAAIPVFVLVLLLGVRRAPAWIASLAGAASAAVVAVAVYRMPLKLALSAAGYGAAFGLFPIGWVVFTAILLFRYIEAAGKFDLIKDSVGNLSADRRIQALLIAFAFGAFIEGAAGFGTPVAVAAAMLVGVGFSPFYAAALCLLANTAPVAFGSIATPILVLAGTTGLPLHPLSAMIGRLCAPISLLLPSYLMYVMGRGRALRGVWPAAVACGAAFAATQFCVSNFVGPQLTDILSSLAAIGVVVLISRFWTPRDDFALAGEHEAHPAVSERRLHPLGEVLRAWSPYALLVLFVLLWGVSRIKAHLDALSISFVWPGLHNLVLKMPPVASSAAPYAAVYTWSWLSAPGTACLFAAVLGALLMLRMRPHEIVRVAARTAQQLLHAEITIAAVLALAFLMNYSGASATLGLAFASTGRLFPFFSPLLGWLGVFLTGSDTSANALFGNLQVVTAMRLHLSPVLMAAANSSGGVMGKMISLQSIAIAAAATGLGAADESRLFRFVLRHSLLLAAIMGLLTLFFADVAPRLVP